jgi:hypothetical protein
VTGQNLIVPLNQKAPVYGTVTNTNRDSITAYWIEDLGGGTGHITVGGISKADGQWISTTSNWANVQYVGGSSPGVDKLELAAYDATTNSFVYSSPFTASSIKKITSRATSLPTSQTSTVTDPPVGNDGSTLRASDGTHPLSLALLSQYMASSFVTPSDGHGGTMITDPPPNQHQLLTQPHA